MPQGTRIRRTKSKVNNREDINISGNKCKRITRLELINRKNK